jgi:hypothetical protein
VPYQLVNGLWLPAPPKPKGEKKITVFLDESSDERQETVYVVAGYIGAEENWKDFAARWNGAMADHGLDGVTFHANLFFHAKKEPWLSLKKDVERGKSLLNALLKILREQAVFPFGAMLLMSDYEVVTSQGDGWDHPHKPCLWMALMAAHTVCEVAPGGSIHFVCDENTAIEKWVMKAFEALKEDNPALAEVFGELETSTDEKEPGLCAADLVAFEVRKQVLNTVRYPHVPMRYPMKRIRDDGPNAFWQVNVDGLLRPKHL